MQKHIGTVILNLINNAFYAVGERTKAESQKAITEYKPTVSIITTNLGNKVEIKVTDTDSGIPQNIADKILQPFFTTKPTGKGTGLGLSISYDIVKAHGGDILCKSEEGVSTDFTIVLPV